MLAQANRTSQSGLGQVRGSAFREFLRWYGATIGLDPLRDAVGVLEPSHREVLRSNDPALGVLASSWYPAELVHHLVDELVRDWSAPDKRKRAQEAAGFVMDATLKGVYRLLFRWMASPARYANYAPRLWSSYYDTGSFSVTLSKHGLARAVIADWPSHHPYMCLLNWFAATEIYRAMGCVGVITVRDRCVGEGDHDCSFVTTWE